MRPIFAIQRRVHGSHRRTETRAPRVFGFLERFAVNRRCRPSRADGSSRFEQREIERIERAERGTQPRLSAIPIVLTNSGCTDRFSASMYRPILPRFRRGHALDRKRRIRPEPRQRNHRYRARRLLRIAPVCARAAFRTIQQIRDIDASDQQTKGASRKSSGSGRLTRFRYHA
jgi:hypothetical protein